MERKLRRTKDIKTGKGRRDRSRSAGSLPPLPGREPPSCKKVKNNPMHSRNTTAGRHRGRSVKPLPRRTNRRQTRNDRGFRRAAPQFEARRQCAIEGRHQFRILRILFYASGKTGALCHPGHPKAATDNRRRRRTKSLLISNLRANSAIGNCTVTGINVFHLRGAVQHCHRNPRNSVHRIVDDAGVQISSRVIEPPTELIRTFTPFWMGLPLERVWRNPGRTSFGEYENIR
jgi:hypothetical protein